MSPGPPIRASSSSSSSGPRKGSGSQVSGQVSLEDELAEATQDLLELSEPRGGHYAQRTLPSGLGAQPLPAPSPLLLAGQAGSSRSSSNGTAIDRRLDISGALGIDPSARLTLLNDADGDDNGNDEHGVPGRGQTDSARAKAGHKDASAVASHSDTTAKAHSASELRFPASQLHHTTAPVDAHLTSSLRLKQPRPLSSSSSPNLVAAEQGLRAQFGDDARPASATKQLLDPQIQLQMDALHTRLQGKRSPAPPAAPNDIARRPEDSSLVQSGDGGDHGGISTTSAEGPRLASRVPAFFLQSFPDATQYLGAVGGQQPTRGVATGNSQTPAEETSGKLDVKGFDTVNEPGKDTCAADKEGNGRKGLMPMLSRPSEAAVSGEPTVVQLHGNRRLEREAAQSRRGSLTDTHHSAAQNFHDDGAHSPLQEMAPLPTGDDTSSLLSLAATSATSPSRDRRGGSRRRSLVRRRRSAGSQSLLTVGSSNGSSGGGGGRRGGDEDEDDDDRRASPFTREVSIRGFSIVGARARGHVAYDVRVMLQTGTTVSLLRRFSSFVALRHALVAECGDGRSGSGNVHPLFRRSGAAQKQQKEQARTRTLTRTSSETEASASRSGQPPPPPQTQPAVPRAVLPPLPPRRTGLLHKYAAHHLETRRRALQRWLHSVMLDDTYGTSRALRAWVVGPDDETDGGQGMGDDRDT